MFLSATGALKQGKYVVHLKIQRYIVGSYHGHITVIVLARLAINIP